MACFVGNGEYYDTKVLNNICLCYEYHCMYQPKEKFNSRVRSIAQCPWKTIPSLNTQMINVSRKGLKARPSQPFIKVLKD